MKVYFSTLAQKEIQDAMVYYDDISSNLGDKLIDELKEAQNLILSFPTSWSRAGKNQRKYVLRRFPYLILYRVYCDRIVIAAFAHQHRKPEYYTGRKAK